MVLPVDLNNLIKQSFLFIRVWCFRKMLFDKFWWNNPHAIERTWFDWKMHINLCISPIIRSLEKYRVFHISLTFLIWLKMTFKCIVHMKTRCFYNHKDPHFDMKHQLRSADPFPVVKVDPNWESEFLSLFHLFLYTLRFVC